MPDARPPSPLSLDQALRAAAEHHQAGRWREAESMYRQVLAQDPHHPHALHLLGVLACQAGHPDPGIRLIQQAIDRKPGVAEFYSDLANALRTRGRVGEALAADRRAVELKPDNALAHESLGNTLRLAGRYEEAIAHLRRAVALQPQSPVALCNLGILLCQQGQSDEGMNALRSAVQLRPDFTEAHYNLGKALREQKRHDEAAAHLRTALQLRPDLAAAHNVLGNILRDQGRHDEAVASYQRAIQFRPQHALTYTNLALAFQEQRRFTESLAAFDRATQLAPDDAETRTFRAMLYLLLGDFERGWAEYEWRWKVTEHLAPRRFPQPLWDGSDLTGRTLLLHSEQGMGDTIQFVRYASLLAGRGARVVVLCQPELADLVATVPGVSQTVAVGDPLPDFDVHCPLLSVPFHVRTTLQTIPADAPYLAADPLRVAQWRDRLTPWANTRRVGLVWAGRPGHVNDHNRSIPLDQFAPLAGVSRVTYFSLQKGPAASQITQAPQPLGLVDFTPEIHSFTDTAAFMTHLDLVISVDTSVAHLAGALGRPVWTLLPYAPDWRWLTDREDSPWYPTMRLFRQHRWGDWANVLDRVQRELAS